ncbi:MFS transporter [Rothia halotolerans]|uniref:MFS transporter n=1 Tax=Rothia halotolerans TaxID=405770 RepID=UPI00101D6D51|nr:MFS transporter [Rothia halotolerans]
MTQRASSPCPGDAPRPEDADVAPSRRTVRQAVAASAIGNGTEWFDYGIFAVSITYITHHFFPGDAATGTLLSLATFAFSFVMRPLGGLFWGPLGDRIGRKRVLAMTILLMAGATFLIGLLPTAGSIGAAAPVALIVLRAVQGFSSGGEYGGAATFMAEYAPDRRRGFYGSFLEFGTLAGYAFGSLIVLTGEIVLGGEAMMEWGWRIPFLVAGPLGVVGLYLRSRLSDSPVFEELEGRQERQGALAGLKVLFRDHWRRMLVMTGLVISVNVVNYTLISYMPTYLEGQVGMANRTALTVMFLAQLMMMLLMPLGGALSDRLGRKPLWYASLVGLIVFSVPMYLLMDQGFWLALLGFAVLGLLFIPQLSTISATFPAMFPAPVRYAGFAITYNVATSVFGGTAPLLNEWLVGETGNALVPAFFMVAASVLGLVATLFMKETAGASLRGTGVPETGVQPILPEGTKTP